MARPRKYKGLLNSVKLHHLWYNMYTRCYSSKYHSRSKSYIGCTMYQPWIDNKYLFFNHVQKIYYEVDGEQMDLDKDILVKGNTDYNPDTVIFTPHSINAFFANIKNKPKYSKKTEKWKVEHHYKGDKFYIGEYDTEEEALDMYIKTKEAMIKIIANEYKKKIPKKLYNAMMNYKIELSDLQ